MDRHGAAAQQDQPKTLIPQALRIDALEVVMELAATEREQAGRDAVAAKRQEMPAGWVEKWAGVWAELGTLAQPKGTTWRVGVAALCHMLIALEWYPEVRRHTDSGTELLAFYFPEMIS